jgi:cell fate regulator YaaT (PSP1 superfamily)
MSIVPLPVFEAELKEYRERLAAEEAAAENEQKTLVVRFGAMKLIGEYRYDGKVKPGCGSRVVARTHRGTELTEVLTVTCKNGACGKSISRSEMLKYIENSGGRDYPFFQNGRVLRIATAEDLEAQSRLEQSRHEMVRRARDAVAGVGSGLKIVDAEPILGGEVVTYYFLSEERVDSRAAHRALAALHRCRVDLRQVGARDEARLTADYERCGQHCCCKNFLKVLKPVSMRSAKVQKATLEPLKISGRCGRLMCCLRYEDETYEELRKRLPHRKSRVGTPHGDGMVLSSQILTQLVLVRLDVGENVAVPVEELSPPESKSPPRDPRPAPRPQGRTAPPRRPAPRPEPEPEAPAPTKKKRRRRKKKKPGEAGAAPGATGGGEPGRGPEGEPGPERRPGREGGPPEASDGQARKKKGRRRRRKKRSSGDGDGSAGGGGSGGGGD